MTVKDLIAELQMCDPDALVFRNDVDYDTVEVSTVERGFVFRQGDDWAWDYQGRFSGDLKVIGASRAVRV